MKKIAFILILGILTSLYGCSIYENMYFEADGKIKYEMVIDAGQLLVAMPSMSDKITNELPSDSVITLSQMIKDKYPNWEDLPQDKKEMLKDIEPFMLRYKSNVDAKQFTVTLYGDFDNADKLNSGFEALSSLNESIKDSENSSEMDAPKTMGEINFKSRFTWNGTQMKRTFYETSDDKTERGNTENPGNDGDVMNMLFGNGRYIVRYYFPAKVKNINNPNALFSIDGKTVTLDMPATSFTKPENNPDIIIELER